MMMDKVAITPTKKPIKGAQPGDPVLVTRREARVFIKLGRAELWPGRAAKPDPEPAPVVEKKPRKRAAKKKVEPKAVVAEQSTDDEKPRAKRRRTYKRRDMTAESD